MCRRPTCVSAGITSRGSATSLRSCEEISVEIPGPPRATLRLARSMLGESHAATLAPQVGAATTPAMGYAHAQFATATPGGQVSYMPVAAPSVSAPMALGMLSNGLNMNGGPNASAGYMSGGGLPRGELQPQVIANGPMVGNPALPATSLASGVAAAVLAQPQGASALGTMMQAGVPAGGPPPSLVNQAQLNAGQLTAQQGAGGGTGQQMNLPIQQEMELELQLRGSLLVQQQRRIVQLEEELSKSWTEVRAARARGRPHLRVPRLRSSRGPDPRPAPRRALVARAPARAAEVTCADFRAREEAR